MKPVRINLSLAALALLLYSCAGEVEESIFSSVNSNNRVKVERWLQNGGDADLRTESGCTLLYLATGPHGGNDVLEALVDHGANVNEGCGRYTPLMNAASWINEEGVNILMRAGANPNLVNENGQTAAEEIGCGDDEAEKRISDILQQAMDDESRRAIKRRPCGL